MHSFPNLRIGLMVGIGGGVPSQKHDIRLGDVVISAPQGGNTGVLQYDFGKSIQNQSFQQTGVLNQPPTVMLTAVNGLEARYEMEDHRYKEDIETIFQKYPILRENYRRPDPESDRLYQPNVVHPMNDNSGCMISCGTDPSKLVQRPERAKNSSIMIHFGTIASGNQLIKDALIRDKLATEQDVLCFEMEAAGLMNHFPCLVVRGICDYSDSHKNKQWQGYAAMVAAAFAKDLLRQIVPNKIEAEKKILDLVPGILDTMSRTEANVQRINSALDREDDQKILDWLTLINYGPLQSDYIRRRQEGTGEWLLNSTLFKAWVATEKKTLFCLGIPGVGKTILTSVVVNNLMDQFKEDLNVGIGYIYCNFNRSNEQDSPHLLASLLKQLAAASTLLPQAVENLYQRHKKYHTEPTPEEISTTLHSVAATYSRVFVIIDALDECQSHNCREKLLSVLFDLQSIHSVNIFATSRHIPDIIDQFKGKSESLEIRASDQDVERYLEKNMDRLRPFVRRNQELQREIKTGIAKAAGGMYVELR
ncbi:hypothetical protein ACHAPX_004512 [Trichoderma viride]